jgi:hypothetical protein
MTKNREANGESFEMGVSVDDVKPGDVIKTSSGDSGNLEKIVGIDRRARSWTIQTESGSYGMLDIYEYGRKK